MDGQHQACHEQYCGLEEGAQDMRIMEEDGADTEPGPGFIEKKSRCIIVGRCVLARVRLKSQVVLLQTAHSWANAGVLLGARMHRERGSFRNN